MCAVWGLEAARQRWLATQPADLVASPPLVRRPESTRIGQRSQLNRRMRRLLFAIAALAGLFGAAGVGAAAAAAHLGGGQLLATAAIFLMIYSAAVFGLVALAERVPRQGAAVFALASVLLLAGMVLFCGDFALRALADRPLLLMERPERRSAAHRRLGCGVRRGNGGFLAGWGRPICARVSLTISIRPAFVP